MWTLDSVVHSVAVCFLAAVVVLVAAGPARAVPSIEFTDQTGGHPLVVTQGIPTLEEFPPELRFILSMFGASLPESNPEVETVVGQAQVTALLGAPVGVEGQLFAKVVDGAGTARGLVVVQSYGPGVEAFFQSDSNSYFAQNLSMAEAYFTSLSSVVADGTMQEVFGFSGLTISVRFPAEAPIGVPVPGSVLLVGCGLLVLRRRRAAL